MVFNHHAFEVMELEKNNNIGWILKHLVIPPCPVRVHWVYRETLGDHALSYAGTLGGILNIG
jgi:hypothetical protein